MIEFLNFIFQSWYVYFGFLFIIHTVFKNVNIFIHGWKPNIFLKFMDRKLDEDDKDANSN